MVFLRGVCAYSTISRRLYAARKVLAQQKQFKFVSADTNQLDAIVKFIGQYHYPQVPTLNCFNDIDFNKLSEDLREDTYTQLNDGLSFYVEDETSGEMVGVAIYHLLNTDLREHYAILADRFKKNDSFYHWKMFQTLYGNVDIYKLFNVPSIVHVRLYCLSPNAQKLGLSESYAMSTKLMAIEGLLKTGYNEIVVSGEANGFHSNNLMERCGYQEIKRLDYRDFCIENDFPYRSLTETSSHSFVTLRAAKLTKDQLGL